MRYLSVIIVSLLLCNLLFGQTKTERDEDQKRQPQQTEQLDTDFLQLQKSSEQVIPQRQYLEQSLEKAIDSSEYVLGPGDQLLIKIWGPLENQFLTEVTPEGYVVIPTIADIKVTNFTLAEGSRVIKNTLKKYFKNANFTVRLVKLRKFRVFVVGEIQNPGTYFLRAADRVSNAIELAGGFTEWGDDTRIQLRHSDKAVDTLNINQFYLTGDVDVNPYLNGGDIIFIPPIDLTKNYVIIEGNVGSEGIYQIKQDETLLPFLRRIRAINRRSNVNQVILIRDEQKHIYDLIKADTESRQARLQTGDRIIVPSNRNKVYVKGEVFQPGSYPYLANYTARDYAGLSGLLETAKDLESVYVIHQESGEIEKGGGTIVQKGDIVVVPRKSREVFKDYLSIFTPIISLAISTYAIIQSSK